MALDGMRCKRALAVVLPVVLALACGGVLDSPGASAGSPTAKAAKKGKRKKLAKPFYGVSSFQRPTAAEFRRMNAGGIGSFRMNFVWQTIQPNPGGPMHWDQYDRLVTDAARAGISLLPLLYGSPAYINPIGNRPPMETAQQRTLWFEFVRAVAARYGRGGAFWGSHPGVPYRPIKAWVVWNEPNIHGFWYPRPRVRYYASFLRLTRNALRSADRRALVGTAGLFNHPPPSLGIPMVKYLRALYKVRFFRKSSDLIVLHPFGRRPKDVLATVREARAIMRKNGDARTPIWITELAWATPGPRKSRYATSPRRQAKRLTQSFGKLIKNRRKLRIGRVLWLAWRDFPGGTDAWPQYTGLFSADGAPKPSWQALLRITSGGDPGPGSDGTGGGSGGGGSGGDSSGGDGGQPGEDSGGDDGDGPRCFIPGILCF